MGMFSQVAKGTIYQVFGKILGTLFGLITVGLMTRYLGQTGFGYYTTAISYLQFFGVLIDFGLQMTGAQMLSRPGADEKKIFSNLFTLRLASAAVFLGSAVALVWLLPYPAVIKYGVAITSLSFLFISMQSVLISVFQKNLSMAQVALAEVWGRLALLLGVWLAVSARLDIYVIFWAIVAGSFINFIILLAQSFRYVSPRLAYDKKIWKEIWDISWPLAITISLTLVYFRADTIILSLFRPSSEVGIYGAAYKVLEILVQFPYLFLGLILPLLAKFYLSNRRMFEQILQKAFDFLSLLVIPMVLSVWVLGDKIMIFVAGGEFALAGQLIKILILGAAAIYLGSLFGYALVAAGLQKKMIKFYFLDAVLSLILYLIFIPLYSYWAAAVLTVFTEVFIAVSAWLILKNNTKIKLELAVPMKSLAAALIMCAVLLIFISQNLVTLIVLGLMAYFAALYFLKGIKKEMMQEIIKI